MTLEDFDTLRLQVIRHEGLKLKPYTDTVGKLTIGVGRNLTDKGLSHDEAMFLLDNDLQECVSDCLTWPWFVTLDAIRQRVIVDMRFNLGPNRLRKFVTTLKLIEQGKYEQASRAMLKSLWAQQVGKRADRLAQMMATGNEVL